MASFWEAQTQPSLYGYRPNASIRDLILMGGQERAQAADRSAAIWMHTLNNVGQQVAQGVQAYGEQKQMAKRDAATVALAQNWQGDPNDLYKGLMQIGGPDYAEKHAPAIMAFHSKPSEDPKTELQNIYVAAKGITDEKTSPEVAQAGWEGFKNRFGPTLIKRGIATPEMLTGDWTPDHQKLLGNVADRFGELLDIKPVKPEKAAEPKVVGSALVSPEGKVIYKDETPKPGAVQHIDLGDRVQVQDAQGNVIRTIPKGMAPRDPNIAAERTATKEDARLDRSYQFNSTQLESLRKPIVDQAARFDRLTEAIDQKTPQADALIAPELLTVMAGGAGSGLRMNEAEISRLIGGRSKLEGLKAAANQWSLDPSKALSITDAQRADIKKLVVAVREKISAKSKAFDDANQALVGAKSVDEHRKILADLRASIASPGTTGPAIGERRIINGEVGVWDGKNWVAQ